MANGHRVVLSFHMTMVMIDRLKSVIVQSAHARSLEEGCSQGWGTTFAHFDGAFPLAALANARVQSGEGQQFFVTALET